MKISDIVALAKAGYKVSDVKELLELCETDPDTKKKEIPAEVKPKTNESVEIDAFEKLANQEV